ncbi:hypothetical protein M8J76_011605 [Diaphorina citri]|nr:hypothetical protein M8J75_010583 [Diaphorina citri]KAI5749938.1 hypothetical protein M8J76_011605 [Diaphorina citri]KAI5754529.1 hypothetical protein M8J77_009270 [Diaphorina citri]
MTGMLQRVTQYTGYAHSPPGKNGEGYQKILKVAAVYITCLKVNNYADTVGSSNPVQLFDLNQFLRRIFIYLREIVVYYNVPNSP